jgi:ABC-type Zn2+ transport system substrate-binding protein/surface adhesin
LLFDGKEKTNVETTTKLGKTEKKLNHYLTNLQSMKAKVFHENYIYFEKKRHTPFETAFF